MGEWVGGLGWGGREDGPPRGGINGLKKKFQVSTY